MSPIFTSIQYLVYKYANLCKEAGLQALQFDDFKTMNVGIGAIFGLEMNSLGKSIDVVRGRVSQSWQLSGLQLP